MNDNIDNIIEHTIGTSVLLMCGISGSGKTRLSKQLEQYGFTRLSVDEMIWEKYGNDFINFPSEERKEIFKSIDKDLSDRLTELLDSGEKIVVDATMCRRTKRESMRSLCQLRGIEPLIIYLRASLPLLHVRIAGRQGKGPNDQIIDKSMLDIYFSNFEPPAENENFITIEQLN